MRNVLIRASGIGAVLVALSGWALAPDAPVADAAKRGDLEGALASYGEARRIRAATGSLEAPGGPNRASRTPGEASSG